MISMRVGKQGIPLWFQCFEGIQDNDAFKENTIKNAISAVSDLFKNKNYELIFLADRWFNSTSLLQHIDNLGHTYCIRLKKNIHVFPYDEKEGHLIRKYVGALKHYKYNSTTYKDISLTESFYKTNIVFSDSVNVKESWIIATNGDPKRAIKDYSYRFGGIECVFKNQKSNGFYLEKISNASLKAFTSMYTMVCFAVLYLTILGTEYSKNSKCYKTEKIETHKTYFINGKNIKKRVISLFNTGLILFKRAFNSRKYIRIPFRFILYDI